MASVLLVEDDPTARAALNLALSRQGHQVTACATAEEGLSRLRSSRPEILVLDVMLPGMNGVELCRLLRRDETLPIILLTALGDELDVVTGLDAGADDYVVKPVEPRVLGARIRAVLRRTAPLADLPTGCDIYGGLVIDRDSLRVTKNGADTGLSPTELRLLLELSRRPGRAYSRRDLLHSVWELDHLADSRLVDACVQRVRAKIEDEPSSPVLIETVRGFGYRFAAP